MLSPEPGTIIREGDIGMAPGTKFTRQGESSACAFLRESGHDEKLSRGQFCFDFFTNFFK